MSPFDDPFAKLEHDAERLAGSLESSDPAVPASIIEAARDLRKAIARTAAALQHRRVGDLRTALETVERRRQEEDAAVDHTRTAKRIVVLEREVEALLSPSRSDARAFYEARISELDHAYTRTRARHEEQLRSAGGASTEMERSRLAALAASLHDEAQTLKRELDSTRRKLDAIQSR